MGCHRLCLLTASVTRSRPRRYGDTDKISKSYCDTPLPISIFPFCWKITKRNAATNFVSFCERIFSTGPCGQKEPIMSNTPTTKPPIYTDVHGWKAPKAAQAGVGARTLQEIREATEAKPRLGDYNNSNGGR